MAKTKRFWPFFGIFWQIIMQIKWFLPYSENLYKKNPYFSCLDIVRFLRKNPKYLKLNDHVNRKGNN